MGTYLKNTILNYNRITVQDYSVSDYFSKDISDILEFIDALDDTYFSWYEVQDNDTLERISQEIYGNPDYWDILLLINHKLPITHMPYNYDTISDIAEGMVEDYITDIYKTSLNTTEYNILLDNFKAQLEIDNENYRIMKIVNPSKINSFLQKGFEAGYF